MHNLLCWLSNCIYCFCVYAILIFICVYANFHFTVQSYVTYEIPVTKENVKGDGNRSSEETFTIRCMVLKVHTTNVIL